MDLKQRGVSVWQALLGRTAFCAALLVLALVRFIDESAYWPILENLMYPWAAALAFPLLRLDAVPKRRGMVFLFGFFLWYIVICYLNRQYSFFQHVYDWYMLLFAMFLFYPQDSSIPRSTLLHRVRVILSIFLGAWSSMCLIALYAAVQRILIVTPSSFFGFDAGRLFVSCHPNSVGYLCAVSFLFALFLAGQGKRAARIVFSLDAVLMYVCLALTDSRTSMVAFCVGAALLSFSAIWGCLARFPRLPRRILCASAAGLLCLLSFVGMRGVFSFYVRIPAPSVMEAAQANAVEAISPTAEETPGVAALISPTPDAPPASDIPSSEPAAPAPETPRPLGDQAGGLNGRVPMWTAALRMMRDHPIYLLTGVTRIGVWESVGAYEPWLYSVASLHNAYLYTFVSCGLPGILLLLGFAIVVAPRAWKLLFGALGRPRRGLRALPVILCVLCIISFNEDLLFLSNNVSNILFFFAAGLVMYFSDPEQIEEA